MCYFKPLSSCNIFIESVDNHTVFYFWFFSVGSIQEWSYEECLDIFWGFPDSSVGKETTCNAGDPGSIPGSGRFPWRRDRLPSPVLLGFPCRSVGKKSTYNAGDLGSIPGLGRAPGEGNGNLLQYSSLENPMDRGGWQALSPWGCTE